MCCRARVRRASSLELSVSSTKRLVKLMAASMLVIALVPASALAGSASGSHVKTPTPSKQQSTHPKGAGAAVLALGSGYSSRDGAARVRALQRRLAGAGYASGPIDGRYGPLTEQAVDRFQAARGLVVDGIAGPLTLAALSRPSVGLYPGAGYAGPGSERVRVLQRRLAQVGLSAWTGRWSLWSAHRAGGQSLPGRSRFAGRRDRGRADTCPPRHPAYDAQGESPLASNGLASAAQSPGAWRTLAAPCRPPAGWARFRT